MKCSSSTTKGVREVRRGEERKNKPEKLTEGSNKSVTITRSGSSHKPDFALFYKLFPSATIQSMLKVGDAFKLTVAKELTEN